MPYSLIHRARDKYWLEVLHWCEQQVSSGLLDSTVYSRRSPQRCSLEGLDFSSDFQFLQSFLETFGDRSKRINCTWYHRYSQMTQLFFSSLVRSKYSPIFLLVLFSLCGINNNDNNNNDLKLYNYFQKNVAMLYGKQASNRWREWVTI